MALTSTLISDQKQAHGTRYCRAKYVDHLGQQHFDNFQVPENDVIRDVLPVRAAAFETRLAEQEAMRVADHIIAGGDAPDELDFATWPMVRDIHTEMKASKVAEVSTLTTQITRIDNAGLETK